MRSRISIRGCVCPSVRPSVRPSVGRSVRPSHTSWISEKWAKFEQNSIRNMKVRHLKDDSKTSTRTVRQNASVVRTLFDLFYPDVNAHLYERFCPSVFLSVLCYFQITKTAPYRFISVTATTTTTTATTTTTTTPTTTPTTIHYWRRESHLLYTRGSCFNCDIQWRPSGCE